jgi:hypothetical protein
LQIFQYKVGNAAECQNKYGVRGEFKFAAPKSHSHADILTATSRVLNIVSQNYFAITSPDFRNSGDDVLIHRETALTGRAPLNLTLSAIGYHSSHGT